MRGAWGFCVNICVWILFARIAVLVLYVVYKMCKLCDSRLRWCEPNAEDSGSASLGSAMGVGTPIHQGLASPPQDGPPAHVSLAQIFDAQNDPAAWPPPSMGRLTLDDGGGDFSSVSSRMRCADAMRGNVPDTK